MQEPTHIDLGPFLAAIVEEAGGEIKVSYDAFRNQSQDRVLSIDLEDDGATLVFRMVDGIPDE